MADEKKKLQKAIEALDSLNLDELTVADLREVKNPILADSLRGRLMGELVVSGDTELSHSSHSNHLSHYNHASHYSSFQDQ